MDNNKKPGTALAVPDDQPGNAIALLRQASVMLAEVDDMSGAYRAIQKFKLIREAVEVLKLGTVAANHGTAIVAKAQLLFGEYVEQGQAAGTILRPGQNERHFKSRLTPKATSAHSTSGTPTETTPFVFGH